MEHESTSNEVRVPYLVAVAVSMAGGHAAECLVLVQPSMAVVSPVLYKRPLIQGPS